MMVRVLANSRHWKISFGDIIKYYNPKMIGASKHVIGGRNEERLTELNVGKSGARVQ